MNVELPLREQAVQVCEREGNVRFLVEVTGGEELLLRDMLLSFNILQHGHEHSRVVLDVLDPVLIRVLAHLVEVG